MMRIQQAIQSGKYPNASTLASELEVSSTSIQRDLEFMRDRMDLPIEYDGSKFGYYYTGTVSSFPTLQITEGELFALLVAEKALQQYRGTNFEKPLLSAFKKMSASLPDTISLNLADWEQTISFRTRAEPILNLEIFSTRWARRPRNGSSWNWFTASPASVRSKRASWIHTTLATSMANGFSLRTTTCARTFAPLCPHA